MRYCLRGLVVAVPIFTLVWGGEGGTEGEERWEVVGTCSGFCSLFWSSFCPLAL